MRVWVCMHLLATSEHTNLINGKPVEVCVRACVGVCVCVCSGGLLCMRVWVCMPLLATSEHKPH